MSAIEDSLTGEKKKLDQLKSEARRDDLDNKIEKLQEDYRSLDETHLAAEKELERALAKRKSLRNELDLFSTRDEGLQKDKHAAQQKMKEIIASIEDSIE